MFYFPPQQIQELGIKIIRMAQWPEAMVAVSREKYLSPVYLNTNGIIDAGLCDLNRQVQLTAVVIQIDMELFCEHITGFKW